MPSAPSCAPPTRTSPQALSGYRPQVLIGLSSGLQTVRNLIPGGDTQSAGLKPWQVGLQINQDFVQRIQDQQYRPPGGKRR